MFNDIDERKFIVEAHVAFDGGGVVMRIRYFPFRQWNKDKPVKFIFNFFVLAGVLS